MARHIAESQMGDKGCADSVLWGGHTLTLSRTLSWKTRKDPMYQILEKEKTRKDPIYQILEKEKIGKDPMY